MKFFKTRKFWLACAALAFITVLSSCSDDDDSSDSALGYSGDTSDLPACKSSNSGTVEYVASEDAYYVCYDGSWQLVAGFLETSSSSSSASSSSSVADSIDSVTDLSECTSATEGNVKYVSSEASYYVCTSGEWTAFATDSTALSSSSYTLTPEDLGVECDSTYEGWIWLGYYCMEGEWRELTEIEEEEEDTTEAECGDFETWLYGATRVETGCDDGSGTYGYWHEYSEAATITWPAELGADTAELLAVMDSCAGAVCGTATFENSDGTSYVGAEFYIGGDSLKGYNILEWKGIDLVFTFGYSITASYAFFYGKIQIELVPEDEENYTGGDNFTATIADVDGASYYTLVGSGVRASSGWEDFEQAGTGIEVPMAEFLTRVAKIRVKFSSYSSTSTAYDFNIYQIGEYGTWSDWPGLSSSSEDEESSSSEDD